MPHYLVVFENSNQRQALPVDHQGTSAQALEVFQRHFPKYKPLAVMTKGPQPNGIHYSEWVTVYTVPKNNLQKDLERAIEEEDYLLAAQIHRQMKESGLAA